ncbi:MAG: hypothetical protein HY854_05565 [Burkholderiales bacterium]|nr:hypothetical protein [Burkholderiales bacterium]
MALMKRASQRCSASWRGYRAKWEVREGQLLLLSLHANPCNNDPPEVPLSELFPGASPPIAATWFTGTLRIPQGKMVEYVHMGYQSRHERYLLLSMQGGVVTSRRVEEAK